MKKIFLVVVISVLSLTVNGADRGIKFFKGTYAEAIEQAKKEKKQIFIDFFTEWCGPCLTMAETVFVLPEVAEVYNSKFINVKIDAEKGEGVELAKKFGVRSYPTYIFVNPATGEMSHRSGGNKPAEDFIADTKGALNPKLSSIYLDAQYAKGGYDRAFLISYIEFKKSSGARGDVQKLFDELIAMGSNLEQKDTWKIFNDCVNDIDSPFLMELSNNYAKYSALHGKAAVDAKLKSMTRYASPELTKKLCDFEGKEENIILNTFNRLVQAKEYAKAGELMDKIIAEGKYNKAEVIRTLSFAARINPKVGVDETPYEWLTKQMEYLRYIAYNSDERDDPMIHYYYAAGLEYFIIRTVKDGKAFPESLLSKPSVGKDVYDTRPAKLKQKPKRK